MKIGNREISSKFPPYIVAEISCNHCGNFDYAHALISEAKQAGADAVKFQCYQADTITLKSDKPDFIIKDGPWKGRTLHELYTQCQTPREWFPSLFSQAKYLGIDMFASVFSPEDVNFLKHFNPPAYKIASMEIVDIPLIEYAAKTGKPLIISTGMADDLDIAKVYPSIANHDVVWLHCVSGYPTPIEEAGLVELNSFADGVSDHTVGWDVAVAATALGASMIEKHLMLDFPVEKYMPEDFDFSMRPEEFWHMVHKVRAIWQAMQPSTRKSEESSRQLRRSLYVVKDMRADEPFTPNNVRSIRPSYGLPPKELPWILGLRSACKIEAGTALTQELIWNGKL